MNKFFVVAYIILTCPLYAIIALMSLYIFIVSLIMSPFEKYHQDFYLPQWFEKIDDFFRKIHNSIFD
jgi:hypothetical protein